MSGIDDLRFLRDNLTVRLLDYSNLGFYLSFDYLYQSRLIESQKSGLAKDRFFFTDLFYIP